MSGKANNSKVDVMFQPYCCNFVYFSFLPRLPSYSLLCGQGLIMACIQSVFFNLNLKRNQQNTSLKLTPNLIPPNLITQRNYAGSWGFVFRIRTLQGFCTKKYSTLNIHLNHFIAISKPNTMIGWHKKRTPFIVWWGALTIVRKNSLSSYSIYSWLRRHLTS